MEQPKKMKVKTKIIFTYAIGVAIVCILFYLIIPYLLNYGPDTINTQFDKEVSGGLYYYQQILLVGMGLILVVSLILFFFLKDIDSYPIYKEDKIKYKENIESIKRVCLNLPNRLLLAFIVIPLLLSVGVLFMQTTYLTSSDFKLMLVVFILSTIMSSIANTYVRKLLSKILKDLENTSSSKVRRTGIVKRLLFQIVPVITVCIVFTYLAFSSTYEKSNAELLAKFYQNQFQTDLESSTVFDKNDLIRLLDKVKLSEQGNVLFITDSHFDFVYQTGQLSDFFKKYTAELSSKNDYKIYDYYGTSGQGTLYPVTLEKWRNLLFRCLLPNLFR